MGTNRDSNKSGQAMVEFCIGLIGMLAVIAGIVQLGRMGLGRTNARVEATAMASAASMTDESDIRPIRSYIDRMQEGADQRSYSVDDRAQTGDPDAVYEQILRHNQPNTLSGYAPGNILAGLSDSLDMRINTGLVQGTGVEPNIPVMPIVRRLFFDQDNVTIDIQAWSVRTGGLY
ncbi:MAG: TadE family protein [Opitutales bacterium]